MLIVKDMVRGCVIVCLINYKGFNPFRLSRLTRRHQKALSPGPQEATKTGIFDAPGCGGGGGGVSGQILSPRSVITRFLSPGPPMSVTITMSGSFVAVSMNPEQRNHIPN